MLHDDPFVVIDVGARDGIIRLPSLRPYIRAFGFEPDPEECARLNTRPDLTAAFAECNFFPVALAGKEGRVRLNIGRNPNTSSTLEPNLQLLDPLVFAGEAFPIEAGRPLAPDFEVVDTFECDAITLDRFVDDQKLSDVDLLKLDTQGSELEIIEGGARVIENTVLCVSVEVEFVEVYRGQPLFRDIDRRMSGLGYTLLALDPLYYSNRIELKGRPATRDELMFAEAFYVRDFLGATDAMVALETPRTARLLLLLEAFGFQGHAAAIARAYAAVPGGEPEFITALSEAIINRRLPDNPPWYGRRRLVSAMHRSARATYSIMPGPVKTLYRRSPLNAFYHRFWSRFLRSRGIWRE